MLNKFTDEEISTMAYDVSPWYVSLEDCILHSWNVKAMDNLFCWAKYDGNLTALLEQSMGSSCYHFVLRHEILTSEFFIRHISHTRRKNNQGNDTFQDVVPGWVVVPRSFYDSYKGSLLRTLGSRPIGQTILYGTHPDGSPKSNLLSTKYACLSCDSILRRREFHLNYFEELSMQEEQISPRQRVRDTATGSMAETRTQVPNQEFSHCTDPPQIVIIEYFLGAHLPTFPISESLHPGCRVPSQV